MSDMHPLVATLPVSHLVNGITPLVNLTVLLGGILFVLHRLRRHSVVLIDSVAVWLSPLAFVVIEFGWIPLLKTQNGVELVHLGGFLSSWPDGALASFIGGGFAYLAARLAWNAGKPPIRRAARVESILFGGLLLLWLSLSLWERLDWWWEHH